jgi:ribosomal subunit interface protein
MTFENVEPVITVDGAGIDLGQFLPGKVREDVRRVTDKYFGRPTGAAVYFSREGSTYRCKLNLQVSGLDIVSAEGFARDGYQAFAHALERAAKQLRRMKRRLVDDRAIGAENV